MALNRIVTPPCEGWSTASASSTASDMHRRRHPNQTRPQDQSSSDVACGGKAIQNQFENHLFDTVEVANAVDGRRHDGSCGGYCEERHGAQARLTQWPD